MKKFLPIILCLMLITPHLSLSQTIVNEEITVHAKDDPQYTHTLRISYPLFNHAEINDLNFIIIDKKSTSPKLKISARINNKLPRKLLNAEITVELNGEEGLLATAQKKVAPRSIERGERSRAIVIELDYTEDITSCMIDITWLGKN